MFKSYLKRGFVMGLFVAGAGSTPALAQSNAVECAAWLCLPVNFAPETCAPAKQAMQKRLDAGLSPLPPFNTCTRLHSAQTHEIWAHQITYQRCQPGYIPAAPGEDTSDLDNREHPAAFYRQNATQSTCLNPETENRYEPPTYHTIKLKIGQEIYEHRARVSGQNVPVRRGSGSGNVR